MTTADHIARIRKKVRGLGGSCPPLEAEWLCDISLAAMHYVEHLERFRYPGRTQARQSARLRYRDLVE